MKPKTRTPLALAALVSAALLATACSAATDSNGTDNDTTVSASSFCDTLCSHYESCDTSLALSTCTNSCNDDNAALVPLLGGDFAQGIVACFGTTDCAAFLSGSALSQCLSTAAASIAPDATVQAFCTKYVQAESGCSEAASDADCLTGVKVYSDAAVERAESCLTGSCSAITSCLDAALDVSGTSLTPTGSGNGGNSGTGSSGAPVGSSSSSSSGGVSSGSSVHDGGNVGSSGSIPPTGGSSSSSGGTGGVVYSDAG